MPSSLFIYKIRVITVPTWEAVTGLNKLTCIKNRTVPCMKKNVHKNTRYYSIQISNIYIYIKPSIYFHFMNNLLLTHNIHHSIFYNSTYNFIIRVLLALNVVHVLHTATLHLWLFPQERLLPCKLLDQRDDPTWQLSNQKVYLHSHTTAGMEEALPCQPHSCDCFFKKCFNSRKNYHLLF